jgi:hypothetical protein
MESRSLVRTFATHRFRSTFECDEWPIPNSLLVDAYLFIDNGRNHPKSTYRDSRHPRAAHIRAQLLGAYERQAERLRADDRKRRTRKESEDGDDDS